MSVLLGLAKESLHDKGKGRHASHKFGWTLRPIDLGVSFDEMK